MWRSPTLSAALTTLYASGPAQPCGRQERAVVRRSERGRTGHHPRADAHAWHARATAQSHFRHARWRRLARRWRRLARRPWRRGRSRAAVEHAQVLWATSRRALMTRAVRADWEAARLDNGRHSVHRQREVQQIPRRLARAHHHHLRRGAARGGRGALRRAFARPLCVAYHIPAQILRLCRVHPVQCAPTARKPA